MAEPLDDIVAARRAYAKVCRVGHSAACGRVWRGPLAPCSCPGRAALVGRLEARKLDREERAVWDYLCSIDPNATAWRYPQ